MSKCSFRTEEGLFLLFPFLILSVDHWRNILFCWQSRGSTLGLELVDKYLHLPNIRGAELYLLEPVWLARLWLSVIIRTSHKSLDTELSVFYVSKSTANMTFYQSRALAAPVRFTLWSGSVYSSWWYDAVPSKICNMSASQWWIRQYLVLFWNTLIENAPLVLFQRKEQRDNLKVFFKMSWQRREEKEEKLQITKRQKRWEKCKSFSWWRKFNYDSNYDSNPKQFLKMGVMPSGVDTGLDSTQKS